MKRGLRKHMREVLSGLSRQDVLARSRLACAKVTAMPEFQSASAVMIYVSMPEEIDTLSIALAAWQHGKTVLAPKINLRQRHMIALQIRSLDSELVAGPYGIREPHYSEPWPSEDIDFVVVPALAFDRKGNRLGRGAGFYDRFFASPHLRAFRCGLSFREQIIDGELPTTQYDQPVDAIVTDREVLRFKRPQD